MARFFRTTGCGLLLIWPLGAAAQRYPELSWRVIETKYCRIYYHQGTEFTAKTLAQIADPVVEKTFAEYGQPPAGLFRVVVRDTDDIANASTYYGPGLIDFYASGSLMSLRGRRNWPRGTFAHEFSHLVSLRANASGGNLMEGLSFGGLQNRYTDTHFTYGGSIYLPTNIFWRWWAEGVAQYDAGLSGFDPWDSHREMLLRTAFLERRLLSFDEMHSIESSEDFGGELVYNQGFSLISFLEKKYGPGFRVRLARRQSRQWYFDADLALERLTDLSARDHYREWWRSLQEKYRPLQQRLARQEVHGQRVDVLFHERPPEELIGEEAAPQSRASRDGLTAFYPRLSPDGHWLAYTDQGILHLLYLEKTGRPPLARGDSPAEPDQLHFSLSTAGSYYTFHPSGEYLVLSRQLAQWDNRYSQYDLWRLDLQPYNDLLRDYRRRLAIWPAGDAAGLARLARQTQNRLEALSPRLTRLTWRARATHPAFSPDGSFLVYSANRDGHRGLIRFDPQTRRQEVLLPAGAGGQFIDPAFSPDGRQLLVVRFGDTPPGIWRFDLGTGRLTCFLCDGHDNRDPCFSADGEKVYFSSDRSGGIFNLHEYRPQDGRIRQLTDLAGGAFQPQPVGDGSALLYSDFTASGYKIAWLSRDSTREAPLPLSSYQETAPAPSQETAAANYPEQAYLFQLLPPRLQPALILEGDFVKGGASLQLTDVLRQHILDLSVLFGRDTDLFAQYTNRVGFLDLHASFQRFYRRHDVALNNTLPLTRDYRLDHYRAGLTLPLFFRRQFSGRHNFDLSYYRKDFHISFGSPVQVGDQSYYAFPLLTDDRLQLTWEYASRYDTTDPLQDIQPRRRRTSLLRYTFVHSQVNPQLSPDPVLAASYDHFHLIEAGYREYIALPWSPLQALELSAQGGYINRRVDPLEQLYAGGRINFRPFGHLTDSYVFLGYQDFSISGEALLIGRLAYHFPLLSRIHTKVWAAYIDSLFASLFGEFGNFWTYSGSTNAQGRTGYQHLEDIGAELRLKSYLFSDYNSWNTVLQLAYGFEDDAAHGFRSDDWPVRIYLGLGVDF